MERFYLMENNIWKESLYHQKNFEKYLETGITPKRLKTKKSFHISTHKGGLFDKMGRYII